MQTLAVVILGEGRRRGVSRAVGGGGGGGGGGVPPAYGCL